MALACADIFDFWGQIGPTERIHPADAAVFRRLGKSGHGFDLGALPGCFMGPLRTAPVVLLFLSPGRGPEEAAKPSKALIDWHTRTRSGWEPLVDKETHAGAFNWWRSRTKCFGVDADLLRTKVATMNIAAYHSKVFADHGLLAALPSSRIALSWAQRVLFPAAEEGKRVVICLRAAPFWGLENSKCYGKSLFAPEVTRGGHMQDRPMKKRIVATAVNVLCK